MTVGHTGNRSNYNHAVFFACRASLMMRHFGIRSRFFVFVFSQSEDFENVITDEAVSVCMCVCPSQAIPRKSFEVITSKLSTVTASHENASRVNYNDLDHGNDKCSIILEPVQAMPIQFTVKIVRLKVQIIFSQSDDGDLHSRSQLCLKPDTLKKPCFGMKADVCMTYNYAHAHFDDLHLDARSR